MTKILAATDGRTIHDKKIIGGIDLHLVPQETPDQFYGKECSSLGCLYAWGVTEAELLRYGALFEAAPAMYDILMRFLDAPTPGDHPKRSDIEALITHITSMSGIRNLKRATMGEEVKEVVQVRYPYAVLEVVTGPVLPSTSQTPESQASVTAPDPV